MTKRKSFLKSLKNEKYLWLMILPAIIFVFVWNYLPMVGITLAFKRFNYVKGIFSDWVGFDNFKFFFTSGQAWLLIKNTVIYNLLFIFIGHGMEIIIALVISEISGKYFKKICQSFIILPYFISWVTAAAFMYNMFNYDTGALNSILAQLNIEKVNIYSTPWLWYIIMPVMYVWKGIGYGSVLYLSSIMGLDQECFEAAQIDGANRFQRIWHITIPGIMPTVVIMFLMSLGKILRGNFDMFYQLVGANSLLYEVTDIIDVYVYRSLVENPDIGINSAVTLFQSVICLVMILIANKLVKSYERDYSLF
ncbi:MAG: sugar ABC transporter permease [Ruminococcaceae bacterium]|nr:sugar ABC transporter permease [Oscillospiraceae bacterium]